MSRSETDVRAGQRLGPYELVRELGRGGFASVWLARRAGKGGFEVNVAIKLARIEIQTDPAFQRMFLDEARLAAQINHPNVVNIFELGEDGDILYLVMEYVKGKPLNVLRNLVELAGGRIPVPIVMRVLAETCAGLHAAHEVSKDGKSLGVIHRDVSPQNILVSDKGTVKLIDFGVAKANDRLAADTTAGHTKGKLRYMAPEQAVGKTLDRRADIWAVGAVAYDLIEGNTPFDGYNDLVRLFKLLDNQPPPAFTMAVPPPIVAVIERCLRRDAAQRYATAADLRTAIEEALDASSIRVSTDQVAEFFRPWLRDDVGEAAPSGRVKKLRERLKRPSMGASMHTIDVPAPDGSPPRSGARDDGTPSGETPADNESLGALNSSVLPTQKWRVPIAGIAVGIVLAAAVAGVWRARAPGSPDPAGAVAASAIGTVPATSAREEPPPPEPPPEIASAPIVSVAQSAPPSASQAAPAPPPSSSPVAAPRVKAHPPSRPPKPPQPASTSRRYDDTIQ